MLVFNIIFFFLLGLIFGSFANVLVDRGQAGRSILGRSVCDSCKRQLEWWENIPVASFLFLRARCGTCKTKLSWQYPAVEAGMGVLFVFAAWRAGAFSGAMDLETAARTGYFVFLSFLLLVIFVWDLKYMIIPDGLVAGGLVFVSAYLLLLAFGFGLGAKFLLMQFLGGLAAGGFFYLMFFFSQGKWIGGGDVKLGFLLGLVSGLKLVYPLLLVAYVSGSIVSLPLLLRGRKKMQSQIPFGPFLVVGAWAVLFFGEKMLEWMW